VPCARLPNVRIDAASMYQPRRPMQIDIARRDASNRPEVCAAQEWRNWQTRGI